MHSAAPFFTYHQNCLQSDHLSRQDEKCATLWSFQHTRQPGCLKRPAWALHWNEPMKHWGKLHFHCIGEKPAINTELEAVLPKYAKELGGLYADMFIEELKDAETDAASLCQPLTLTALSSSLQTGQRLRRERRPRGTEGAVCCCQYHSYCKCGAWARILYN